MPRSTRRATARSINKSKEKKEDEDFMRSDPMPRVFASERNDPEDSLPIKICWLDLLAYDDSLHSLGISSLPGCRYRHIQRDLDSDIETIKNHGIEEVFVLCTIEELNDLYQMPHYLENLVESGLTVSHFPIEDGKVPADMADFLQLLTTMAEALRKAKGLIHCFGGLGRSCTVASCLLMFLDAKLTGCDAMDRVRAIRAAGSLFSVKQYNFINDFPENAAKFPILK